MRRSLEGQNRATKFILSILSFSNRSKQNHVAATRSFQKTFFKKHFSKIVERLLAATAIKID